MIKKPKKKVSKRTSKKVAKRKVNKKSFRRNPEDYDEPIEYTEEQIKELNSLLIKRLEYSRKSNSGENSNFEILNVIDFLKNQIKNDPESSMYIVDAAFQISKELGKIISKWENGEKVVIPEFIVEFD